MQFCFRVQLNVNCGGLHGEALYFDTEGNFRDSRIIEMAQNYFSSTTKTPNLLRFKTNEVLTRIHVRRITSVHDLCNNILSGHLDSFLAAHINVRLFILDGIAYPFRYDCPYSKNKRMHLLELIACKLKQIARERNVAVSHNARKLILYLTFVYCRFSLQIK